MVTPLSRRRRHAVACGAERTPGQAQEVGSLCRTSEQHAMTGPEVTYCVNVCMVARAPQLLGVFACVQKSVVVGASLSRCRPYGPVPGW